jgi:hypothetical protein
MRKNSLQRMPLRLRWHLDPATGRVEGTWEALSVKRAAQRRTSAVSSLIDRRGAR